MCGIIGYVGEREAYDILIKGLKRLEYRGYDSAGIATLHNGIQLEKVVGRVSNLKKRLEGNIGIGHTRWATHGKPTKVNAHPHLDEKKSLAIVHNGIIENYLKLKERLKGHKFKSETDSEVIAHILSENYKGNLKEAVIKTVKQLKGAYAFAAIHKSKKEIVVARNGCPVVIGLGKNENFIGSDASAFIGHTKKAIFIDDMEIAVLKDDSVSVFNFKGGKKKKKVKTIDMDVITAQRQGYKHFMLKEIMEQHEIIRDTLKVDISPKIDLRQAKNIYITACGTAFHAGLVGKYIIEKTCKKPVFAEVASEFRYREPLIGKNDVLIAISQSGETADTLAAVRLAKKKGAKVLAVVNIVNSTIARESHDTIYTRAGPEISVASTKAFISQLIIMYKIAEYLSGIKFGMQNIAKLSKTILNNDRKIRNIAEKYFKVYNFMYIGRTINYPIALEGALKLKEISYIHAEGYAAGELKHGPLALVTDEVPTVAIIPKDKTYEKMFSNIEEIKARGGKIISIATAGDKKIRKISDDVIYIPKVNEMLYPILAVIPLQLLAYYIADHRECDIDKPRNLAKSVTVE